MPRLGRDLKRLMGDDALEFKVTVDSSGVSVFMHPNRRLIFSTLCRLPCAHLRELARHTKLSPPTVKWHLERLLSAGYVYYTQMGHRRVYYPATLFTEQELPALCVASDHMQLYKAIASSNGITQRQLSERLCIKQQAISQMLAEMQRAGIVQSEGRPMRYTTTTLLAELKERAKERNKECRAHLVQHLKAKGLRPRVKSQTSHAVVLELNIGGKRVEWSIGFMPKVLVARV